MKPLAVPVVVASLALSTLGIEVLNSVTAHHAALGPEARRQLEALAVGVVVMIGLWRIPSPWLSRAWPLLYAAGVAGLVLVRIPGIGVISHGARRWISMGALGAFQPSEPAKIFLIMAVASLLAGRPRGPSYWTALGALLLAAIPCGLICSQPDLGTAVVLMGTVVVLLVVSGASPVVLLGVGAAVVLIGPHFLHDYQRNRMMVYLHPEADPAGLGYNLMQARIAIGSGGQWGTGLLMGPLSQSGFVPENHTDFIFSVIGEELGLSGCIGFIALWTVLVTCVLQCALCARERYDMLLVTGIAALLGLHGLINVGMVIGLLPATGVPLPFVSYGGTAIITQMAALGLVLGVCRNLPKAVAETDEVFQTGELWGILVPT